MLRRRLNLVRIGEILILIILAAMPAIAENNSSNDEKAATGLAIPAATPNLGTSTLIKMQSGSPTASPNAISNPDIYYGDRMMPPLNTEVEKVQETEPSDAEKYFNQETPSGSVGRRKAADIELQLKQIGYAFFSKTEGYKPDPQGQVGPDYILGPGDTLRIDVWGSIEGNYMATINRNGEIVLPKIGAINLWGQSFKQATDTIQKQIGKYFSKFELNVTLGALRSVHIYIVGEVQSPGTYQVGSLSTVLSALSEAGGPTKSGSLRNIQLRRNGQDVAVVDLYDFILNGDSSADVRLQSGDTLFVPVIGPVVAVAGDVRRPAIYELKGGETLSQALDLAGGLIPTAYLKKVQLERVQDHQFTTVLDLDISTTDDKSVALDMTLQDHDRIKIAPIAVTGGYVRLVGHVMRPGDYQLTPGMRLIDLILPFDNLLPEFFPDMAQVIRTPPPEYRPEMLTVNLQKALAGDPKHNILLQEYDTVRLFARSQMQDLPQVVISGAVLRPGKFRLYENMTVKDLVALAGSIKQYTFLSEAELTRYNSIDRSTETKRIIINLGKALRGESSDNLILQADDHLFIRSIPDSDKKSTVQIKGEVLFPGTYAISKGEKLASLIQRAGGYSDNAYLRGSFFTRESLKETQLVHTDRLIAEQEQEIYRISSVIATGALSEEDVAASQAMLKSRQELLDKLKQAPVTGRMVIHLEEPDILIGTPYNIELLDGDTLTIPFNPKTVTVLGQVYTPVSMAYDPGQTVGYYLDKVGGPRKTADLSEIYVVRADGSVFSKQQVGMGLRWDGNHNQWQTGGFYSEVLYPGDVLLVPEKIKRIDWMKEIRDISTILYQITLGAAVILAL